MSLRKRRYPERGDSLRKGGRCPTLEETMKIFCVKAITFSKNIF